MDWQEKEAGFTVTFPNKTLANREQTTKWITDAAEKRNKQNGQGG